MEENNFNNGANQGNNVTGPNKEAESGKVLAILAYLGILVLIPFFSEKDNSFVIFHAKQGLNLFILEIIGYFAASLIGGILHISGLLSSLVSLMAFVLSLIGIIAVVNGEKKELPLISSIKIIK